MEFVDLHTHSTRSDGMDSVQELIDNAASVKGLRAFALCDHDVLPPKTICINGRDVDPCEYARERGVEFLPAIEVSCDTDVDDVHIVGLFCDFESERLRRLEADVKQSKCDGYKKLCELLVKRGMDVSWQYVLDTTGRAEDEVQRKHIFECIAAKGYAADWKRAKLLVRDDSSLNVKREKPNPLDVIDWIHAAQGVAILAHPFLIDEELPCRNMNREAYIEALIERGLDGMEADYPYEKTSYKGTLGVDEIVGRVYRQYGPRLRFLSGGSDYHAEHKKGMKNARFIGEGRIPYRYFQNMIFPMKKV